MANYYNAIVVTASGEGKKYRKICQLQKFIDYCTTNFIVDRIIFYRLPNRESREGNYVGYWNAFKGLNLN